MYYRSIPDTSRMSVDDRKQPNDERRSWINKLVSAIIQGCSYRVSYKHTHHSSVLYNVIGIGVRSEGGEGTTASLLLHVVSRMGGGRA